MEHVPTLLAAAEISAGLLGFAAIISVFRGDLAQWVPEGRFWVMLALAASSFGVALLPIPLLAYVGSEPLAWGVSGAGTIVAGVGAIRVSVWGGRVQRDIGIQTHWPTLSVFLVLLGVILVSGVSNLGLFGEPNFARHLTGVVALQLSTVLFFVRLLRLWLAEERPSPDRNP